MKKLFILAILFILCSTIVFAGYSTIYNPYTGKLDYINDNTSFTTTVLEVVNLTVTGYTILSNGYMNGNIDMNNHSIFEAWDVNATGEMNAATLNTGQGDNELYDMNQNVLTTSIVGFAENSTFGNASHYWRFGFQGLDDGFGSYPLLQAFSPDTAGNMGLVGDGLGIVDVADDDYIILSFIKTNVSAGSASIDANFSSEEFIFNWDIVPSENATYDLGGSSLLWKDGYFSGNVTATYLIGDGTYITGLESYDQDLNTTSNVVFNKVTVTSNGDSTRLWNDGSDAYVNWTDGALNLWSEEANTIVQIGKNVAGGSGTATLIFQDDSGAYHTDITQDDATLSFNPLDSAAHIKFVMNAGDWLLNNTADADTIHVEGSTGFVGIGVAAPATKLDVDGTVKATEFSGDMNWTMLQNYPVACPANTFISQLNDSVTCTQASYTGLVGYLTHLSNFTNDLNAFNDNIDANGYNMSELGNLTFSNGATITQNSTCLILKSPDGTGVVNVCNT